MRCNVTQTALQVGTAAACANSGVSVLLRRVAALDDSAVPRHQGTLLYGAVLYRGRGCKVTADAYCAADEWAGSSPEADKQRQATCPPHAAPHPQRTARACTLGGGSCRSAPEGRTCPQWPSPDRTMQTCCISSVAKFEGTGASHVRLHGRHTARCNNHNALHVQQLQPAPGKQEQLHK